MSSTRKGAEAKAAGTARTARTAGTASEEEAKASGRRSRRQSRVQGGQTDTPDTAPPGGQTDTPDTAPPGGRLPVITRRRLLGTAGAAGAVGLVAGGGAGAAVAAETRDEPTALASVGCAHIPFQGPRQAGIVEPAQARGHLVAFDLVTGADRRAAAALLRRWSSAVREMTAAHPATPAAYDDQVADDAGPSSLTVTFGFGRGFFARTGLTSQLPDALAPLPHFPSDALDAARSDGDLWVQIGANDALVAFHALRVIQKAAHGTARVRWQMNGFNRTPGATDRPRTVRNLMGQIDGTNNPKPTDADFDKRIFVPANGSPEWMAGGSYAVFRRIRMLLDSWDDLSVAQQERVIGRRKSNGAPLSGGTETTPVQLDKFNPDGSLAIAGDAHIRVAAPASNGGAAMLRRTFSFHDGIAADGTPDAGLLFIAWQADPMTGFVPVQRKLDGGDGLTRFLRHEASGLFAVPPGPGPGEYVGQRLLEG